MEQFEERLNPAGTFVASSVFDNAIYAFDATTGALQKTLIAPNSSPLLSGPAGLAIGPDRNLYISSQTNNAILQYNLTTDTLSTFIPSSSLQPIAAANGNAQFAPAGLQFGPDGDLYVSLNGGQTSASGGAVVRFDVQTATSGLKFTAAATVVASGMIQPTGLTFGTNFKDLDTLYVSNSGGGSVVKVASATSDAPVQSTFIPFGTAAINYPAGISWGHDGRFYVVDLAATSFQGQVVRFNANGTGGTIITPVAQDPGSLALQFPASILFDGRGHFLTANLGPANPPQLAGSINQYNLDGTFGKTLVTSASFPNTGPGMSGIAPSQLVLLPPANPVVATSFFDSALYQFDSASGALLKTLVAPNSSSLLSGPAGVTLGPDQNLYISSQFNNSILQYNTATDTLKTFIPSTVLQPIATASGNAQFAPAGLQFGPENNLYVTLNGGQTSTSGGAVVRFDIHLGVTGLEYAGSATTVATGLVQPSSLTFGRNIGDTNNLYVSNSALKSVVKVDTATSAAPVSTIFITAGAGDLDFPSGLTWGDDGKLYVVDLGATNTQGKIAKFNVDGTPGGVVTPASGPGNLQFQFPSSIVFDGLGHFLTANLGPANPPTLQGSINQYNANGTFVSTLVSSTQFPSTGPTTSGFAPAQLVMLPPAPPLLFSSYLDNSIYQVDSVTGQVQKTLIAPLASSVLSGPAGLTIGPDRNLYISSQSNNSILKYNLLTDTLSTFIPSSVLLPIATSNGATQFQPSGLQFGPDGNLYVGLFAGRTAATGGAVVRFDVNVGTTELVFNGTAKIIATGLVQPSGVAFGAIPGDTNNLYVTSSAARTVVKVANATSANPTSTVFITSAAGTMNYPTGLTWGPDGKLYVADLGATNSTGKLVKFNADGSIVGTISPPTGQPGTLRLQFPSGVIFNNRGNILTANLGAGNPPNLQGSVYQYELDGSFDQVLLGSGQFPSTATGRSGTSPSQVALAPLVVKNGSLLTGSPTPNPSNVGQPVTWTVTVSPSDTTVLAVPTGSVTFSVDGGSFLTVNLTGNQATFTTATLSGGVHALTAFYNGDGTFAANTLTVKQTVASTVTTTTLTANPSATTGGTLVTFTATVAPSPGNSGSVTFKDGGVVLPGGANVPLVGGVAIYATSTLSAATHPITAEFSGSGILTTSTSNTLNFVVSKGAPQIVSITPNGNIPSLAGAQRGRLASFVVVFDQTVKLDPGAMTLALHTSGVSFGGVAQPNGYGSLPTSLNVGSADSITWVVTFVGNTDDGADGFNSLKDGLYDFTIDANKVHSLSNPNFTMAASSTTTIHRLFGDTNAPTTPVGGTPGADFSAIVNTGDNLAFRGAFNNLLAYKPLFDFTGDGNINSGDNLQFRGRFNKALIWKA